MPADAPLAIKLFNDRVRAMNQSNGKLITLNAQEARNLHTEIYDLLSSQLVASTDTSAQSTVTVVVDGGTFK